jgi:hypothetical protein
VINERKDILKKYVENNDKWIKMKYCWICKWKNMKWFTFVLYVTKNDTEYIIEGGSSWPWWYGSWIYNCFCNQCLKLWVRIPLMARCVWYINSLIIIFNIFFKNVFSFINHCQ